MTLSAKTTTCLVLSCLILSLGAVSAQARAKDRICVTDMTNKEQCYEIDIDKSGTKFTTFGKFRINDGSFGIHSQPTSDLERLSSYFMGTSMQKITIKNKDVTTTHPTDCKRANSKDSSMSDNITCTMTKQ